MRARTRIAGALLIAMAAFGLPLTSAQAVAAPTTTGLSPSAGPLTGGTSVIVTGTDFTSVTRVWFGTRAGTGITVQSKTQLKVTAPAGIAGTVPVRVTAAGGTTPSATAIRYRYVAPPSITISPDRGPLAGGTKIMIAGVGSGSVTMGGVGQVVYYDLTSGGMWIVSPPHAEGPVNVTVTTAGGSASARFIYADPPNVVLTPSSGPTTGGSVQLNGTGLYGLSSVRFGTAGSPIFYGDGIRVSAPPHAAGTVDVTITAAGGTQVLPYTYLP